MTTTATAITAPTMSQIFGPVWLLELGIGEASSLHSHLVRLSIATLNSRSSESFTRPVATRRRIGSMAAQSLTCIPARALLFEPEPGKHPPRHVSAGTTSSYPQGLTLPTYTMPREDWSVKKCGSR